MEKNVKNITFDKCVELLKSLVLTPIGNERVFINQCIGRVLCEDILAIADNPKFNTSNMDGYAFNSADFEVLRKNGLKISSINKAGNVESCTVQKGECIKTFTGAKMPQNADCLVIVENVEVNGDKIVLSANAKLPKPYQYIRKAGENYQKGSVLLPKGTILTPFSIGILAQNHNILLGVYRKIRIGILSGGDELLELGEVPKSQNYIYSSNNHTLCAITTALGAVSTIYPLLQDNPVQICESITNALCDNDIVITTGGMSKGDFDFTKDVILKFGKCVFSGVQIKPGKVIAYIKCEGKYNGKHIFALPGNPSSSIVSFLLFGRMIMQKMFCQIPQIPMKKGKLLCNVDNTENDRLCFELADLSLEGGFYSVSPRPNRSSYMINDFSGAFCMFAQKNYKKGDFVDIILLNDLLRL